MGQLVEVVALTLDREVGAGSLLGAGIDDPAPGRQVAARELEISGWVLDGAGAPPQIEARVEGTVLARGSVDADRPDIAAAFPDHPRAASSGYRLVLDATALPTPASLELYACGPGSGVWIGRLELRRLWRAGSRDVCRLVSVVVVGDEADATTATTVESIAEQRYWPIEIVLALRQPNPVLPERLARLAVRALSAQDPSAAGLRNEAIRRSEGGVILFVPAGASLRPHGVGRGMTILDRRPEIVAVIDGSGAGDVAAGMYRRSGFEELAGFESRSGDDCDRELAQRAAGSFDVHEQAGILLLGGGG